MSWLKSLFKKYRKQAIQPKKKKPIIDLLIFEPYKFSLVKAIDVLKLHSDILIIKSNLHFSSKYSTVYKVEGVRDGYVELYTNFVSIIGIDGSLPDAYVEKWTIDYGYSMEIIEIALKKTTSKTNINFEYLNKIITDWHERNLKTAADIQAYLKQSKEKDQMVSSMKKKTNYNNSNQRKYDNLDNLYANN